MDAPRPPRAGSLTSLILATLNGDLPEPTLTEESIGDGMLRDGKKQRVPDRAEVKMSISDIQMEIERVKDEIAATIDENLGTLEAQYASSYKLQNEVAAFFRDLEEVIRTVDGPEDGARARIETLLAHHETLEKDIKDAEEVLDVLLKVAEWHSNSQALHRSLASSSYLAAAQSHLESCRLLSLLWEICPGATIVDVLKEETENGASILEARCEEGLTASLIFTGDGFEVRRSGQLDDILKVLHLLGAAEARHHLAPFTRGLVKNVLTPIVDKRCTVEIEEDGDVQQLIVKPADEEPEEGIGALYVSLFDVFTFIHSSMLRENREFFCTVIGSAIWEELAPMVVEKWLEPLIPEVAADLDGFKDVETETEDFMKALEDQGFTATDERFDTLLAFCRDMSSRFIERKRKVVLGRARTMILVAKHKDVPWDPKQGQTISLPLPAIAADGKPQPRGSEMPQAGFQLTEQEVHPSLLVPLFPLSKCALSSLAPDLVSLVGSLLSEAAMAPSAQCTRDLVNLAHGIPRLYRATKPRDEVPALAARMHNDCHFLASELEGLGIRWRDAIRRGPKSVDGTDDEDRAKLVVTFASEAEELRRLGKHVLNLQFCIQRDELVACLGSAGGFEMAEEARAEDLARAVKQVTHVLGRLGRVWKPVLPAHVFLLSMGLLIGTVCDTAISEIESLKDIGADESARMTRILESLRAGFLDIFGDAIDGIVGDEGATKIGNSVTVYANYYAPSLKKLTVLGRILDSSFAKIMEMFRAGKLRMFALGELTSLVRAVFADTALRQKNLEEILRGHPED